jgi:Conjugative transposon protein TcpC
MTADDHAPDDRDGGAIDVVDDRVSVAGPDVDEDEYAPDEEVVDDLDALVGVGSHGEGRSGLRWRDVVGSVLLARIATACLWLLVIGAVVLAVVSLVVRTAPPQTAASGDREPVRPSVGGDAAVMVAGFAQMAIRRYVGEAGEDAEATMDGLVAGGVPPLDGVTPGGYYVVDAVTVAVEDLGGGYWSATVACDLMASIDEQYGPVGVRYYSVGVATGDGGGPVLVGLPAMVPAPAPAQAPELAAASLDAPDPDDPQVATIREFLGALLLGQGSISRYTAPGVRISAIDPPPFTELEVQEVAIADPEAEQTAARVTVHALDERGLAQRLQYALDLQQREGRWEIARLAGAPPVDANEATGRRE